MYVIHKISSHPPVSHEEASKTMLNCWRLGWFEIILEFYSINLGGGLNCFLFSSLPGEMIQFDYRIFFKWVVQPPPRTS